MAYDWTQLTKEKITSYFLYGTDTPPADLTSESRIRPIDGYLRCTTAPHPRPLPASGERGLYPLSRPAGEGGGEGGQDNWDTSLRYQ